MKLKIEDFDAGKRVGLRVLGSDYELIPRFYWLVSARDTEVDTGVCILHVHCRLEVS